MNYLEWNNLLGQYFFNEGNAGKEIYLYITKNEIIELASDYFHESSSEEIWMDFIKAIKRGIPGSNKTSLIDKAVYALEKSDPKVISIEGTKIIRPAYIAYLTFFVLPLIEHQGEFTTSNYYDRLKEYMKIHGIDDQGIRTLTFQKISHLWEDLSAWANVVKHKDLGSFTINKSRLVYVGKPFSQCIFPPKSMKRLPEFFLAADMIPDSIYESAEIKRNLLRLGQSILSLSSTAIRCIRASESDDLGQSIIEKTQEEYVKWSGESHTQNDGEIKRNVTTARIYLQFQPFTNSGSIKFSFRMRYRDEFPEDLNFSGLEILEERGGYSRTLNLPFREKFNLRDDFTKWVAKFPEKEVRLFISAGTIQLSTDYWIETDTISKINWMYLLCKNSKRERVLGWLKSQCSSFEDESDYTGMPVDYSLYKFLNPKEGLSEIPELTIHTDKNIQLVEGLKFDFRTFTEDFMPEVEVSNADGTEEVYLHYKDSEQKVRLEKNTSSTNRWLLPKDTALYDGFKVRIAGETYKENEITYRIISSDESAKKINDSKLPKRDSFGRVIVGSEILVYSVGSNTVGVNPARQIPYQHIFRGIQEDSASNLFRPEYEHTCGNMLISFLTLKGILSVKDFYAAFDLVYSKCFYNNPHGNSVNYSVIKKASLNFLDYLGFLDYEYQNETIVVNTPQLIFIPSSKGRKVLLIGGRDRSLIREIMESAPDFNLQVEIIKQLESNERLLLPDAIIIKAYGTASESHGEASLVAFAQKLGIRFNPSELVQVGLQHFCSDLDDYETALFENEASVTYEDWAKYIFNPQNLILEQSLSGNFDKSFSLLEYRLRPWEFHYRIWKDNKCYDVDRNWGRYVALKHFKKNVILYDRVKEKVAVPVDVPLPRLLAESIILLSGLAPEFTIINGIPYRIYENIPSIFIQNLFIKLRQTVNEQKI